MKFIHTSDWHIGRQFHGVSLLDDQIYVLDQIVELVKKHKPDALVIAGDIYDRAIPPTSAVDVLDRYLNIICAECKTPVILISGNHDNAQRLGFGSNQLAHSGLHILSDISNVTTPVVIRSANQKYYFYGIAYHTPELVKNIYAQRLEKENIKIKNYDDAHTFLVNLINEKKDNTQKNILISHCFVDGAQQSDSERPLSIGGSDRVSYQPLEDFDYVALGHLHSPQYRGANHIRYSGSILKYSFSEQYQKKGVTLVELTHDAPAQFTHIDIKAKRNMRVIEGELDEILKRSETDAARDDYLLVRLTDKAALLEPMSKLRQVYPNVLQLEKTGLFASRDAMHVTNQRERIKRDECDMFNDFFNQITGNDITEKQKHVLEKTLNKIKHANQ